METERRLRKLGGVSSSSLLPPSYLKAAAGKPPLRADMAAVGELVLVLGLLVSAHCEVRARDPELEEEGEARGGGGGGAVILPHLTRLHPGTTQTPPLGETGNYPARTGNLCAFVQKHTVTAAVACGTEKYIIKSQSPCPSGLPNCQLVMYKLSTRLVYTQKEKVVTKLHWACCQGHGGHNCEDTEVHMQQQRADPNREQNDYDASYTTQQHNTTHTTSHPDHTQNLNHTWLHNANGHHHGHHHQEHRQPDQHNPVDVAADVLPYSDTPSALPVPHMMALVMSQLQPVLQAFNRSLEHLSQQVGNLAHEVAQLKSSQQGPEMQAGPPELDNAAEERLDVRLGEVFDDIRMVQREVESQRMDWENKLHSQHAMLHYNLTSFKTDIDIKLKRHQKMLQASLQAMNATLSELKLDQEQSLVDPLEGHLPPPSLPASQPLQSSDTSGLWEAIKLLDNMVVNNTVKVTGLMEDVEVTSGNIQQLKLEVVKLDAKIVQTARTSMIHFMETGLELEDAKAKVLRRVKDLEGNMSLQCQRLREMDSDVDKLFKCFYNKNLSGGCSCQALNAAVVRLEQAVVNVTELAQENRLALEESSDGGDKLWDSTSDWARTVQALQHGLQQVKESLASEQSRTRTLDHNVNQLRGSVMSSLADVTNLKETDRRLVQGMEHLSTSFHSLLQDGIRHSDVLELLLGEEVLEFLEWPVQEQEAHSIPALKEKLRKQGVSIELLLENRPGGREEVPSADQPSSSSPQLLPSDMRRSSGAGLARERQLLLHPEHKGDGSDLWNLEKQVEELKLKLLRLEGKPCLCSNTSTERELQAEVMSLKRGLEVHLGVFKNIFRNTDVLAGSDATLDLYKLWELLKSKGGKKEKRGGGGQDERRENHRSRRDSSGVPSLLSGQLENSVLFVAGSPLSISKSTVLFKASVKTDQFQPDTGTFTASVDGIYLFIITLDLRPGPVHVVLRKGDALVSLHRQKVIEAGPVTDVGLLLLREGEKVRLELNGGVWVESGDNLFTGLLLHRTT
ncbi:multimerin-2a isoform X2 [Channa argus]|uniref:multimerin-2a isoform X2 n=1 Tax=Channa argus TaxID=215402 RepID=UPI00351FC9AD